MKENKIILVVIAIVVIICIALAGYFTGYSVAKEEDKIEKVNEPIN